jgi:GAF domain-containing protein
MQSPQTWRALLQIIIKKPAEKERLARAIGVDAQMFMRWIKRDETPSSHQLYLLLDELPQHRALLRALILEEIDDFSDGISPAFPVHILDLYNTAPDEARFWSICSAVFSEALQQLDRDQQGLSISVVQCMAHDNTVYCLRECVALGTAPWNERIEQRTRFLGAESLAGHAIASGSIQVIADSRQEAGPVANLPEHALSAAAIPILYTNRVAGCLLIASTQQNYFRSLTSVNLIKEYASLLTLAFSSDEFYVMERIALQPMPLFQEQQPYLSTLRQRIQATWKTAFSAQHSMSYLEVQRYVWWQIAEELLQLPPSQLPSM